MGEEDFADPRQGLASEVEGRTTRARAARETADYKAARARAVEEELSRREALEMGLGQGIKPPDFALRHWIWMWRWRTMGGTETWQRDGDSVANPVGGRRQRPVAGLPLDACGAVRGSHARIRPSTRHVS